jgi:RIO kinase 1
MQNKSAYGRGLIEDNWQDMEFHALRGAFDAGVRVPEPYFLYENVLFMELIVDAAGAPASRLADFTFTAEEATRLHQEVFLQVKTLLGTGRIHGDLSAYNVLMAAKGPTLIDMPQIVEVSGNNNARQILRRDLRNVTEHLARFDARLLRFADCGDGLFHHMMRGTLDMVAGPEVGAPQARGGGGGGGRRGRDAERGRAGRDKGQRPGLNAGANPARGGGAGMARPGAGSPGRPGGGASMARPGGGSTQGQVHAGGPSQGGARGGEAPRTGARPGQQPSYAGANHRRRRRGGR